MHIVFFVVQQSVRQIPSLAAFRKIRASNAQACTERFVLLETYFLNKNKNRGRNKKYWSTWYDREDEKEK